MNARYHVRASDHVVHTGSERDITRAVYVSQAPFVSLHRPGIDATDFRTYFFIYRSVFGNPARVYPAGCCLEKIKILARQHKYNRWLESFWTNCPCLCQTKCYIQSTVRSPLLYNTASKFLTKLHYRVCTLCHTTWQNRCYWQNAIITKY